MRSHLGRTALQRFAAGERPISKPLTSALSASPQIGGVGTERVSKLYGCEAFAENVEFAGSRVDAARAERPGGFELADSGFQFLHRIGG